MADVKVIEMDKMWVRTSTLAQLFELGNTHVRELIKEMRLSRRWRGSVVCYQRVLRVNLADFEKFWKSKSLIKEVNV